MHKQRESFSDFNANSWLLIEYLLINTICLSPETATSFQGIALQS